MKSYEEAVRQFRRVATSHPGTPEALAADLDRADALHRLDKPDEAIEQYVCAIGQIEEPLRYDNPYVPLPTLRKRLEQCWRQYFAAGQYERAMRVAGLYEVVALEGDGVLLRARSAEQWARSLKRRAVKSSGEEATKLEVKARNLFRQAGAEFGRLAELRRSDQAYSDYLWMASQCLIAAGEYSKAVAELGRFVHVDDRDSRYPQALVDWGTCLEQMGRQAEAARRFAACYTRFPKNHASYRARVCRARCLVGLGKPKEAAKMLLANLEGSELSPDAIEWRESLFALGHLYYSTGQYKDAVTRLGEAVARYPQAKQAELARYWQAEAFRRWADESDRSLPKAKSNRARLLLKEQRDARLDNALDLYRALVVAMSRADDAGGLSALRQANLRNSYFAVGDCLYRIGRYPEAIVAYKRAANRYQDEPDCLGAYVQMHNCYRRLGQTEQARRVVEQARWILRRMPTSAFAERPNVMSKEQWNQWLDSAAQM